MTAVFFSSPASAAVRAFLAPDNWFGFGGADLVVLLIAAVFLLVARFGRISIPAIPIPQRIGATALALAGVTVVLRLVLLPWYPVPAASGADDFGYWLLADTLHHLRLANPTHDFPAFFEQIFVLQRPTYSSMFNLGQGLAMALGWTLFGHPWAGVLLSGAALTALCYWALRGWTSPGWSLAGGLLAIAEFGPLSYWTNSYWGGAVSACAGFLVFGAIGHWRKSPNRSYAWTLGLGLGWQLLTRPFEFFLLLAGVLICVVGLPKRPRLLLSATPLVLVATGLIGLQNKAVTGSWVMTPYLAYRNQYGIPAAFTFQRNPVPHRALNPEQQADYEIESATHGNDRDSFIDFGKRLLLRVRFYRFFLLPPLALGLLFFLFRCRSYRQLSLVLSAATFVLGSNFYPYLYPHYIAAAAPLFLLMGLEGLRLLEKWRTGAGISLLGLCCSQFLFWYLVRLCSHTALVPYESWDFINWGDPQGRLGVQKTLDHVPGKLLVFVHYSAEHRFSEWVHNAADIDASRIIWVHDLGDSENARLRRRYPERKAMLCEPDATPPFVHPYALQSGPFEEVR